MREIFPKSILMRWSNDPYWASYFVERFSSLFKNCLQMDRAFKTKKEVVKDMHRAGRPETGWSRPNITRVHRLIEENPQISLSHLQEQTRLCRGTLVNIIQRHLKVRKLSSRWIPYIEMNPSSRNILSWSIHRIRLTLLHQIFLKTVFTQSHDRNQKFFIPSIQRSTLIPLKGI